MPLWHDFIPSSSLAQRAVAPALPRILLASRLLASLFASSARRGWYNRPSLHKTKPLSAICFMRLNFRKSTPQNEASMLSEFGKLAAGICIHARHHRANAARNSCGDASAHRSLDNSASTSRMKPLLHDLTSRSGLTGGLGMRSSGMSAIFSCRDFRQKKQHAHRVDTACQGEGAGQEAPLIATLGTC